MVIRRRRKIYRLKHIKSYKNAKYAKLQQTIAKYAIIYMNFEVISICATVCNSMQKYVKVTNLIPCHSKYI